MSPAAASQRLRPAGTGLHDQELLFHPNAAHLITLREPRVKPQLLLLLYRNRGRMPAGVLQAWVDRLGFQREYPEHGLVYPPQRVAPGTPFQGLESQRVLPQCQ